MRNKWIESAMAGVLVNPSASDQIYFSFMSLIIQGRFKIKREILYIWVLHNIHDRFAPYFAHPNGGMPVFSGAERKQTVIQMHRYEL